MSSHNSIYGFPRAMSSPSALPSQAAQQPTRVPSPCSESNWVSFPSPQAPLSGADLRLALGSLSALPGGLASNMRSRSGRARRSNGKLAREGQNIQKFYSAEGPRPYPTNGLDLEQGVQLEMSGQAATFFTVSTTPTISVYASRAFTVSDFSGASNLLSVFDQYKIDQIECWVEMVTPNVTSGMAFVSTVVDIDDANVPTSAGQVVDKIGAISGTTNGGRYHKWKPHVAEALYSGTFTSYGNMPSQWIDSASPSVQHYGIKAVAISNAASAHVYSLVFRAVISFRAPVIN